MSNFRDPETPLTEEQILLRKQVLYQAESEPDTFQMNYYEAIFQCGTTRCLAGWAEHFALGRVPDDGRDTIRGITLLGLTKREYYGPDYPEELSGLFYDYAPSSALARFREITENPHYEEA